MNWLRILKWVGIFIAVPLSMLVILIVQGLYRVDLYLTNPVIAKINSNIERFGDMTDLTPDVFVKGMTESEAASVLVDDGFARMTAENLWQRYKLEFERGDHIYLRDAATLVCNSKAYVFVRFSPDKTLISAEGTMHGHACL